MQAIITICHNDALYHNRRAEWQRSFANYSLDGWVGWCVGRDLAVPAELLYWLGEFSINCGPCRSSVEMRLHAGDSLFRGIIDEFLYFIITGEG